MGAYGNTQEECEAKINTYRNPDARCRYPFTCDPLGYCWSYANYVDGTSKFKDMAEICPGCEFWTDTEEMSFGELLIAADKFKIPHDEIHWPDPDKEDALRVAVAEAMERVGK